MKKQERNLKGVFVISGGVFGKYEDIIVDNYLKPKLIWYGQWERQFYY